MNNKKIFHFGTFDVSNYGDLLFPLIVAKHLNCQTDYDLVCASPVGGKPNFHDCVESISVNDAYALRSEVDAAIIGGGNIIHCERTTLSDYQEKLTSNFAYYDLWVAPSIYVKNTIPVLWNAPGVPQKFHKQYHPIVKGALQRADYLSVRDSESKQFLLDVWSDASIEVMPDTAWMINTLWKRDYLTEHYQKILYETKLSSSDPIVILHLNQRYTNGMSFVELAATLDKISVTISARPLLIPIGACHGDKELAESVSKLMCTKPLVLKPHALIDIAACIAHAKAYIGSSLHGLITASSFGVPGMAVASLKVAKFKGISNFIGDSNAVVESWGHASELADSKQFSNLLKAESIAREIACNTLERHWSIIYSSLSESNLSIEREESSQLFGHFDETKINESKAMLILSQEKIMQEELENRAIRTEQELLKARKVIINKNKEIMAIKKSYSWKFTKPFRKLYKLIKKSLPVSSFAKLQRNIRAHSASYLGEQELGQKWFERFHIKDQVECYASSSGVANKKIAVYTAIFGDYDTLLMPEIIDIGCDYICFTDKKINNYGIWQIRPSPYYHMDATRMARYVKTHPHVLLKEYDYAVWIDGNVCFRSTFNYLKYIECLEYQRSSFGTVVHPLRACVYKEAEACKQLSKDDYGIIDAQMREYGNKGLRTNSGLYETNFMIICLKDEQVRDMFSLWWRQINKYSRRDQLGLPWALHLSGITVGSLLGGKGISVREHDDFQYFTHKQGRLLKACSALNKLGEIESPYEGVKFYDVKERRLKAVADKRIDIIVCVYNALEDVKLCLNSVIDNMLKNHHLIIVNDCSDSDTSSYLREFSAKCSNVTLIENKNNLGYTQTANIGLKASNSDFKILLNSDTIVSPNWALKMLDVAQSTSEIGIVGALSNAAGKQTIPSIKRKANSNNSVINILPSKYTPEDIDLMCEKWSLAEVVPFVPLIHGFCFGIKSEVIDKIGYFDAVNFERYYGEENDYAFRAGEAGFIMAVATNTFVYHRKSMSISEEERIVHMGMARSKLHTLYGETEIKMVGTQLTQHHLLELMRNKAADVWR